jgi:acetylornithine deacetylase/succinyl-diaminopimelate desuccinylase-like protein
MAELPVESHTDAAGNLWFTLTGQSEKCLLIGGHIDSVPNGGWLDGCLNLMAGVEMAPEVYQITERYGGVCTIRSCITRPGIVTSVVQDCTITLDQRHLDAGSLAAMLVKAKSASERFAQEGNVSVTWERIWEIEPVIFNSHLVEFCDAAILETCGVSHSLPSGPLHDAAEVSRAGIPTVMMFVQSLHGISHNKIEDTLEEHLALCVEAFDRLAEKTMEWIVERERRLESPPFKQVPYTWAFICVTLRKACSTWVRLF